MDDDTTLDDDGDSRVDLDGDGYTEDEGDCDDHNPDVKPGAEEVCDGMDNNCDGVVDEGFLDSDEDGIVDCLDHDCEVDAVDGEAGVIPLDSGCQWDGTVDAEDPWDIVLEWSYEPEVEKGVIVAPTVGRIVDDYGHSRHRAEFRPSRLT